jgi:hypothetical protein
MAFSGPEGPALSYRKENFSKAGHALRFGRIFSMFGPDALHGVPIDG